MTAVLLTGGAGRIGRVLRTELAGRYATLRIFDRNATEALHPSEDHIVGDLADMDAVHRAMAGMDAVIHLGGLPDEAPFEDILQSNILGTYHIFEAARHSGVPRVVYASTNHVTGFYGTKDAVSVEMPMRPDTFYGVSKGFGELLAQLYHDKWGLEVVCLRIGSFRSEPSDERQLSTWLSHRDGAQLIAQAVEAELPGLVTAYAVSDNSRNWWSIDPARMSLGYKPVDDAEAFADRVAAAPFRHQGGAFTDPSYRGGLG